MNALFGKLGHVEEARVAMDREVIYGRKKNNKTTTNIPIHICRWRLVVSVLVLI